MYAYYPNLCYIESKYGLYMESIHEKFEQNWSGGCRDLVWKEKLQADKQTD